jgi:glycerol-3-phosphate dehydrogenase
LEGVAEGVATAPAALKLVERHQLRAPMIRAMAAVLAGEVTMRDAAEALMRHPATSGA